MRDIYVLDLHTHTYASGHAYNTMNEMAYAAKEKGLQLLGITDHAPAMPNLKVARREKYGLPLCLVWRQILWIMKETWIWRKRF